MVVFVSGGSGFLGSYLIRHLLQKGYQVRALKRKNSDLSLLGEDAGRVQWFEGDVLDYYALLQGMEGVDIVFHSAAIVSFDKREKEEMMRVNVEGTANMVNAALESGLRRFLHVSSVAALGRSLPGEEINENQRWEHSKYNSDYGLSKFYAERELWRGIAEGLNAVIINPSMIIGAGFWEGGTAAIFDRVATGLNFYTLGANGLVDVRDVAEIALALAESDLSAQRYIVSAGSMDLRDLVYLIADTMGKKRPAVAAGPMLMGLAWRIEKIKSMLSGKKPVLTRQSAMVANNRFFYNNDKLRSSLNFQYRDLESSIRETAETYMESISRGKRFGQLPFNRST